MAEELCKRGIYRRKMPLTLEQETELLPLAEKASNLIVNLIVNDNSDLDVEFHRLIGQISVISPFVSKMYMMMYNHIPKAKSRLIDYLKDNI